MRCLFQLTEVLRPDLEEGVKQKSLPGPIESSQSQIDFMDFDAELIRIMRVFEGPFELCGTRLIHQPSSMQLKHVLGQIDPDDVTFSDGCLPLLCVALTPRTWHIATPLDEWSGFRCPLADFSKNAGYHLGEQISS